MPKTSLFKDIKWGVTKDGHVPHIIEDEGIQIDESKDFDHKEVSHDEIFINPADNVTKVYFLRLAHKAQEDYAQYGDDKDFASIMHGIKDYLTADGRQAQQDHLRDTMKKIAGYVDKLPEDSPMRQTLVGYQTDFLRRTNGSLKVTDDPIANTDKNGKIREPASAGVGVLGAWVKSEDALFPHEPSPNDIKQGLGAQDCFMLSALTKIAADHPEQIRDAMVDNGDGTVTVRFYDYRGAEAAKKKANKQNNMDDDFAIGENEQPNAPGQDAQNVEKKPVYITVNKTVSKAAGLANTYSSGSLWVQLFEKAYATYRNVVESEYATGDEKEKLKDGYNAINRSHPHEFLNAFTKENYTDGKLIGCGMDETGDLYDINSSGKFTNRTQPGYTKYEKDLHSFLEKNANSGEVITVGAATSNKARKNYALSHGIRLGHAYTVVKAFEKEVDGEMKKFVQLRDPYATFSSKYDKDGNLVNNSQRVAGTLSAGTENMGVFNLEISDFCSIYTNINAMKDSLTKEYTEMVKNTAYDIEKPDITPERQQRENAISEAIKDQAGFDKLNNNLKELVTNLGSTDKWFVATNSDEFVAMRKSLYGLAKKMNKIASENRLPNEKEAKEIVDGFTKLYNKTNDYVKYKEERNAKEKPSERATYRLEIAKDILGVCGNDGKFVQKQDNVVKNVSIAANDMAKSLKKHQQDDEDVDDKEIEELIEDIGRMRKMLKENPSINAKVKIDPENKKVLSDSQKLLKDTGFEEIKKEAPVKQNIPGMK